MPLLPPYVVLAVMCFDSVVLGNCVVYRSKCGERATHLISDLKGC